MPIKRVFGKTRKIKRIKIKRIVPGKAKIKRSVVKRKPLESYYYRDTSESSRKAADKRLIQTYGITTDDYDRMYEEQGEKCYICKHAPTTIRFSVDHRHVKGYKKLSSEEKRKEVRGLLCFCCNTIIGKLEKYNFSRQRLEEIVKYFLKYRIRSDE